MTVSKITTPPTAQEQIDKINEIIDNLGGGGTAPVWGNITGTLSDQTDLQNALNNKANIPYESLYNGASGNPKPIKFVSVDYNNANSENGIFIQITMQSSHGNGRSYAFYQDAFININYEGSISCEVFKYFGATTTYNSTSRQYGDIFWVHDSVNKIVDFYTLMGQFSALYYTPYRRLNLSTGGVITQYTSATAYSDGTQEWASCGDYYTTADPVLTNLTTNATSLTIKGTPIPSACGNSINIGYGSSVGDNGEVCIGVGASTRQIASTAIGFYASATKTNAIQIGTGTNSTANTFYVGFRNVDNYQLLDGTTGYIPNARINMDTTVTASSTNAVTSGAVSTALQTKQDTLVSGTNIKTINGNSILGSGDLTISGGGGGLVYSATCPAITISSGIASWSVTHNLGTQDIVAILYNSSGAEIEKNVIVTSSNAITVSWNASSNVSAGDYKIVVIGSGASSDTSNLADKNLSNVTNTANMLMAHNAMPSDTYETLTLGASGTSYTAPADGYVILGKSATSSGQVLGLYWYTASDVEVGGAKVIAYASNNSLYAFLPVRKGGKFRPYYNVAGSTDYFRFVYAQGSESEAS